MKGQMVVGLAVLTIATASCRTTATVTEEVPSEAFTATQAASAEPETSSTGVLQLLPTTPAAQHPETSSTTTTTSADPPSQVEEDVDLSELDELMAEVDQLLTDLEDAFSEEEGEIAP